MSIVRQDAWTNDEDLVLAEVVLRHIREGSTQLAAFDEVGERLSRTSAACGFRWNSSIRKKYEAAIAIAKKQRKNLKKTRIDEGNIEATVEVAFEQSEELHPSIKLDAEVLSLKEELSIDDVIDFLVAQKEKLVSNHELASKNILLTQKVEELSSKNEKLTIELNELQENYELMKQDYKLLIDIMDRAKQLSVSKN